MHIKPFRALYPNFDYIASPDSFCADAKNSFNEFQGAGFFERAPKDSLYIYQIETEERRHTGLIALNAVNDYFAGTIKKHENTLSDKEQQQMQLFLRWHAILKPVLLTFPPAPDLGAWLDRYAGAQMPLLTTRFEKDGETHRIWAVSDETAIQRLQELFEQHVPETYIADGHHRTTTVALLHERLRDKHPELDFDDLLCAFFPADQLDIKDFNRVVSGLRDMTPTHFIVKMSQVFDIEILDAPRKPVEKYELVMYVQREWYSLRWKPALLERYPPDQVLLDATLLNEWVMRDILGIVDERTDTRIRYIEGTKGCDGIRRAVHDNEECIGFMLYPIAFDDLRRVADAGQTLPPKSTFFLPRMKTGMLVKMLGRP